MAIIIIEGNREESEKALNSLKNTFDGVSKRSQFKTKQGTTTILEVFQDDFYCGEYTKEEVLKALECHSNFVQNCTECPYRKEKDCINRLLVDGTLVVHKMMGENSSKS